MSLQVAKKTRRISPDEYNDSTLPVASESVEVLEPLDSLAEKILVNDWQLDAKSVRITISEKASCANANASPGWIQIQKWIELHSEFDGTSFVNGLKALGICDDARSKLVEGFRSYHDEKMEDQDWRRDSAHLLRRAVLATYPGIGARADPTISEIDKAQLLRVPDKRVGIDPDEEIGEEEEPITFRSS